jgi:hypothetical protein
MANEQVELKVVISQDTVDFVRGLSVAGKKLDDFGKDGKFSINSLETALKALKKQFDSLDDPLERQKIAPKINEISNGIKTLNEQYKQYKRTAEESIVPTEKLNRGLRDTEDPARRARIAVYGLNQVVRDLPFGFIAISNNIPVLIDQFNALREQEGSTRKALQAFSAGLVGAGGVSIALSVVVSAITSAVQKYGSLQKAFDALIGTTNSLRIAKEAVNNEVVKSNANATIEIGKIEFLVRAIQDNTLSQEQRINAYKEFKKLAPGVIKDMTQENALTASGALLLQQRSQQLIQYIKLKGQEGALVKLLEKANEKRFQSEIDFLTNVRNFANGNIGLLDRVIQNFQLVNDPANFLGLKTLQKDLADSSTQSEFFADVLKKIREELLGIDPQVTGIEDYKKILDELLRKQAQTSKSAEQARTKEQKAIDDANRETIKGFDARIQAQQAYIKNLSLFDKNYWDSYQKLLDEQQALEVFRANIEIADARKLKDILLNIDKEYLEKARKAFNDAADERKKITAKETADRIKEQGDLADYQDSVTRELFGIDPNGIQRRISDFYKLLNRENKLSTEQLRELANTLSNVVGGAVNSLFDALSRGDDIFGAIGESLKRLIIQLAATVIKAAALAAILSLIPGGGLAVGAASATATSTGGIGNIFKALLNLGSAPLGGGSSPIVGPGGVALSGQVVFVQRGTDLVGVLDRSNARIGRVG